MGHMQPPRLYPSYGYRALDPALGQINASWKSWKSDNDNSGQIILKARKLSYERIISIMIVFRGVKWSSNMYSGVVENMGFLDLTSHPRCISSTFYKMGILDVQHREYS